MGIKSFVIKGCAIQAHSQLVYSINRLQYKSAPSLAGCAGLIQPARGQINEIIRTSTHSIHIARRASIAIK